jgi:5-methyltetrahydropteroyltriglutamate--homocysteine methyltransferase
MSIHSPHTTLDACRLAQVCMPLICVQGSVLIECASDAFEEMEMRSAGRILTTHVGSLVRPAELVSFLKQQQNHQSYDLASYEECLRRSVAEVVQRQSEVGIDIVSDGEFGKSISWSRYVLERISGFEERQDDSAGFRPAIAGKDRRDFADFYDEYEAVQGFAGMGKDAAQLGTWVITAPIRYIGHQALQRDIANLKAAMKKAGVQHGFLPVVAPASVVPARKDEHYRSEEEALFAIAEALSEEYRAIVDAGLTVQVDDAFLASSYDVMVPPRSLADYRKWAAVRVEAVNHALRGIPAEQSRYHLCWGSWNGPHTNDVAIKDIIDLVLRIRVGGYSLEMANPRHEHEWRVWEKVGLPKGRVLFPGLVSHSTNVVEHPELVAERIVRLAKLIGRENVVASTDCGFAQGPFARRVHPSIMWAKLRAVVEGARLATRELWRRPTKTRKPASVQKKSSWARARKKKKAAA